MEGLGVLRGRWRWWMLKTTLVLSEGFWKRVTSVDLLQTDWTLSQMLSVHVRDKGSALKEKKGKEEQKKKPPLLGKRVQLQRQSDPFEAVSANREAVPSPHQPCHFFFFFCLLDAQCDPDTVCGIISTRGRQCQKHLVLPRLC